VAAAIGLNGIVLATSQSLPHHGARPRSATKSKEQGISNFCANPSCSPETPKPCMIFRVNCLASQRDKHLIRRLSEGSLSEVHCFRTRRGIQAAMGLLLHDCPD